MKRTLQIGFIFLILLGTSSDAILRQFFPQQEVLLDVFYFGTLMAAAWVFSRLEPAEHLVWPRLNADGVRDRNPLMSLWTTHDPLLLVRFFAAFLVFFSMPISCCSPVRMYFRGRT